MQLDLDEALFRFYQGRGLSAYDCSPDPLNEFPIVNYENPLKQQDASADFPLFIECLTSHGLSFH